MKGIYPYIKRGLDILLAVMLGIPSAFIVGICVVAIKLESDGPVFFVQKRPGYKGHIFKMYKLRSMRIQTHCNGVALSDMERVTKTGKIIRLLSLDELPQLYNILTGDMSFIGPRPLLESYLPLYTEEQMKRHNLRPGVSGWAQVNGRNALSWEQKFDLDVWYVEHLSFRLDLKIFWMTIMNVIKREGVNAGANETMHPFQGTKE